MEADSFPKLESNGNKSDEEEEEILGSDNDEQEDPKDYCKGFENCVHFHVCKIILSHSLLYLNLSADLNT